ncbi:hypothetical protein Pan258_02830 [Symmachiella dynata]|nr:hypothetical protein Pan258_02830 [Symmachiella dynata]
MFSAPGSQIRRDFEHFGKKQNVTPVTNDCLARTLHIRDHSYGSLNTIFQHGLLHKTNQEALCSRYPA